MKQLSLALAFLVALCDCECEWAYGQVTPLREASQQQPATQRPTVPPRTYHLTNLPPRRNVSTSTLPGNAPAAAGSVRGALPPGSGLTNATGATSPPPVGILGTNTQRLPPMGVNILPSGLPGTNILSTNGAPFTNRTARPITPAQRIQIARLAADLNAMRSAAQITPAQKEQLLATLRMSALGVRKPAEAALTQFVNDLLIVWPTRGFTPQQKAQLAIDFNRVLNGGDLSPVDTQVVINDARRIFQSSGMSLQAVEMLARDLALIAAQTQGVAQPATTPPSAPASSDPPAQTAPR